MKRFVMVLFAFVLVLPVAAGHASGARPDMFDGYRGLYRVAPDHVVGVDAFINDDGDLTMLYSDYRSGIVRRLFGVSDTEFVMGPNFNVQSPVELKVKFVRDKKGAVTAIALEPRSAKESTAARIPLKEVDVVFQSADAKLAGTLIIPPGNGPHPAIILLHGSGPLTRHSFGPYPQFFASLGLAVLIYDKRGTGASTGTRLDASTAAVMTGQYPNDLRNDALAAFDFLHGREDIDPKRIGFWGSSEGGMLVTQAAAHQPETAFIIDSSGFMGPLWETILYQATSLVRRAGGSESDVAESVNYTKLWMSVARTGKGWDKFVKERNRLLQTRPYWLMMSADFTSLEQMQWYWSHVLTFSPLPDLMKVSCPVLAVYGEKDVATEAIVAAPNITQGLIVAGNQDITVKVFPRAKHSLAVADGNRMAPGVFDTLRTWLIARAHLNGSR